MKAAPRPDDGGRQRTNRFAIHATAEQREFFRQRYRDSRHGQGYVCKRIAGSGASTYLQCVLQASAVSDVVTVTPQNFPASFSEETTPGLEVISQPYMY